MASQQEGAGWLDALEEVNSPIREVMVMEWNWNE
jgi:hypothetical protein